MTEDKRIRIIIGHYGSGKTEFAVNYAMKLNEIEDHVAICDLDVINPYFRTREKAELLESNGIKVISGARGHSANLAIPMVSSAIVGPIQNEAMSVVLDVGGDAEGARTLGRYLEYFTEENTDIFFVVNTNRPETATVEGVIEYVTSLEKMLGKKVTGLIVNTHLLKQTTKEDVMAGYELTNEVSEKLDIPIKYVVALEEVTHQLSKDLKGEIFPIRLYMREEWMM